MERKIGEIFELGGEWYQCLEEKYCNGCVFRDAKCDDVRKILGNCSVRNRSDKKSVIFKKLEKVGSTFTSVEKLCQHYKVFDIDNVCGDGFWCVHNYKAKTLTIEIKQTKEDMEEKKLNLKPFDIQKAREGKPVCTRDGHKARILCYDLKGAEYPIVAAVETRDRFAESIFGYDKNGRFDHDTENNNDLMMLPEKKEGWAKVRKDINLYDTKEEADRKMIGNDEYVTAKVCWEE